MQSKDLGNRSFLSSDKPVVLLFIRLALILLPMAVFLPSIWNAGFVGIDDSFHLLNNKELTQGHWSHFWQAPYFSTYIPVTYTAWTILYQWTQEPFAFHLLNLILHIANTLILFEILIRIFDCKKEAAFLGSLIFALHPLQAESVMWVSGCRELLATFFALFSVLCLGIKRRPVSLGLSAASFALSLLAKPIAVLLPFFYLSMFRKERKSIRWSYPALLLVMAASVSLLTLLLQNETYSSSSGMSWSPWRTLISLESIGFSIQKLLWPVNLSADYGRSLASLIEKGAEWNLLFIAVIALLSGGWMWQRLSATFRTGLLWIGLALLPNLGLIPFGFEEFSVNADRYMNFAMAGVAICLSSLLSREDKIARALLPPGWVAVAVLAFLSYQQAQVWTDDLKLMNAILEVNPQSKIAAHNLGVYFAQRKDDLKASQYFLRALAIDPQYILSCAGLITSLSNLGQWKEADLWMKKCLGDENRLKQYSGTVQLSGLYAAGGYFLLKGPKNFSMAHDYFCESLKHHSENNLGQLGARETENLLQQNSVPFQSCFYQ